MSRPRRPTPEERQARYEVELAKLLASIPLAPLDKEGRAMRTFHVRTTMDTGWLVIQAPERPKYARATHPARVVFRGFDQYTCCAVARALIDIGAAQSSLPREDVREVFTATPDHVTRWGARCDWPCAPTWTLDAWLTAEAEGTLPPATAAEPNADQFLNRDAWIKEQERRAREQEDGDDPEPWAPAP